MEHDPPLLDVANSEVHSMLMRGFISEDLEGLVHTHADVNGAIAYYIGLWQTAWSVSRLTRVLYNANNGEEQSWPAETPTATRKTAG